MNYRRDIVSSEEYKELINSIYKSINAIDQKIIELEEKRELVKPKIMEYRKIVDELNKKSDSLSDKLYNNFRANQRKRKKIWILTRN